MDWSAPTPQGAEADGGAFPSDRLPAPEPEPLAAAQQLQRRVLVVDDEPAMRLLCRVNLPFAGFEVVEAGDGDTALELLRRERFDIVLLDVMMPGLNGFRVAEQLHADASEVPIVFLSARADLPDVRRGLELGALDYVTKPFDPLRIGDHLLELLAAHERGDDDTVRDARLRELDEA